MPDDAFRLGFVPGVTPAKWATTWSKRHRRRLDLIPIDHLEAGQALAQGQVDIALLRPEVDRETISTIPLYEEVSVVLASRDHLVAALDKDEVATADLLAKENFLVPRDDVYPSRAHIPGNILDYQPATTKEAVELVATGMGLLIAPMSLARLYHRKDVVFKELALAPTAPVYLAWLTERYSDAVEDFIGIVRGRTVNSTRGRTQDAQSKATTEKGGKAGRESRGKAGRNPKGKAASNSTGSGSGSKRGTGAAGSKKAASPARRGRGAAQGKRGKPAAKGRSPRRGKGPSSKRGRR